jgi:hypothetical protein
MQRSRSQVLFSYLPHAVFVHESGVIVRSYEIAGEALTSAINKPVLLGEIDRYLAGWTNDNRVEMPSSFVQDQANCLVMMPELVRWEIWPLVFECNREGCKRIHTFTRVSDVTLHPRCRHCGGHLRQLRYFAAHDCGASKEMYVPRCQLHGYDHVYFEDTGSFRTAMFRCRACGGDIVRRTALTPCGCQAFPDDQGRSMMRAYTVRDTHTYYPHYISFINFQSPLFSRLQSHPARGEVAIASYLQLAESISDALRDADHTVGSDQRMTGAEWQIAEARYRKMGLNDGEIEDLRHIRGPRDIGLGALAGLPPAVLEMGASRPLVERAMLFDRGELPRVTLQDATDSARERGQIAAEMSLHDAQTQASKMGIEEVAVSWEFPVAMGAFGYTRAVRGQGEGRIHGFAQRGRYEGKAPVFAVATETEAAIITVSAVAVLRWLTRRRRYAGEPPTDLRSARQEVLEIFARREVDPAPADEVEVMLHSMSHALLRALAEGQIGFGESTLAEWIVPETLTFALYANSLKSYTLGALWTLINNRSLEWLQSSLHGVFRCENDPLCHQREPRACERCLYLTFGCRTFNDRLSRTVLGDFWTPEV